MVPEGYFGSMGWGPLRQRIARPIFTATWRTPGVRSFTRVSIVVGASIMSPRSPLRFRDRELQRAIRAARKAGIDVGGVAIDPDGEIRIISKADQPAVPANELDAWVASKAKNANPA